MMRGGGSGGLGLSVKGRRVQPLVVPFHRYFVGILFWERVEVGERQGKRGHEGGLGREVKVSMQSPSGRAPQASQAGGLGWSREGGWIGSGHIHSGRSSAPRAHLEAKTLVERDGLVIAHLCEAGGGGVSKEG